MRSVIQLGVMLAATVGAFSGMVLTAPAADVLYEAQMVFDPADGSHGHVHASCITQYPNGDLLVVWYENGAELSSEYFSKDKDKSDNVRTGAAKRPGSAATFDAPFVIADTFGLADNNPCVVVDRSQQLWLIRPTLLGVPDWSWGSALVRYQVSDNFQNQLQPVWKTQEILVPHLPNLTEKLGTLMDEMLKKNPSPRLTMYRKELEKRLSQPLITRLGWMPRNHPLVRNDGAVVLPLSNENFNLAVMAITTDSGATWQFSQPVPEVGLTQPTVVQYSDGKISAFFRNGGPERRIKRSDSDDGGMTWSAVTNTTLLHPGAGIEAVVLKNGHLVMVYNDKESGDRDQLAVSISHDRGETWPYTRHLENTPQSRFDYPSVIQALDGSIHVTYSYNLQTIKHVRLNEEWVEAGD
jgi:hypothetical protein